MRLQSMDMHKFQHQFWGWSRGGFVLIFHQWATFSNKCKFMAGLATEFGGKSQQELLYAMALWQDPDIQRFILWYVRKTWVSSLGWCSCNSASPSQELYCLSFLITLKWVVCWCSHGWLLMAFLKYLQLNGCFWAQIFTCFWPEKYDLHTDKGFGWEKWP